MALKTDGVTAASLWIKRRWASAVCGKQGGLPGLEMLHESGIELLLQSSRAELGAPLEALREVLLSQA